MVKVGYVVKRYPRYSETFIVNELLAHEQAGLPIEIFSLRPPVDTHFQDLISRVKAPLTYLSNGTVRATELWSAVHQCQSYAPQLVANLGSVADQNSLDVYCGLKLALAALRGNITHLHAHFASSATSVARIASKLSGIPYSITAHAKDIFHESVSADDLERKIVESQFTFTVSDFNFRFLQETVRTDQPFNLIRLYNGIDLDQFPFQSPRQRRRQIIAVGRFVEKKGFSDLIDACQTLRRRGVDFNCIIVGSGDLQRNLQSQIDDLQLGNLVQLLGAQPQRVVKDLIAESAVLAAPCILGSDGNRDGLPTVLLEAMALGTPCVSTDVTGIPEIIHHEETGLMVPEHDSLALADALERLLGNAELRERLSRSARSLIAREFDIHANTAIQRSHFGFKDETELSLQATQHQYAEC